MKTTILGLFLIAPITANAAELIWDGHYRARSQIYNSLSLSDTNPNSEGVAFYTDHRLRLQPGWLMSSQVGLFAQIDVLPYVLWGDETVVWSDPALGESPLVLTNSVSPPTQEGASTPQNLQATRVYGEVQTAIGQLRFGRMPLHWGSGMMLNAGNDPDSQFGDTADRVQFTSRVGEVYLQGGVELNAEQFVGEGDDIWGATASIYHKTERMGVGLYNSYRTYRHNEASFGLYTADLWGAAEMGPVDVEMEFAAQYGRGDLDEGIDDATIAAFGGMLTASFQMQQLSVGLGAGFATGDKDTNDKNFKRFTFDPDFNQTLFLFEQNMPTLEATVNNDTNGGRDTSTAQTGQALSNALYIRPTIGWTFNDKLSSSVSLFAAKAAAVPDVDAETSGYGSEINASLDYAPVEHFTLNTTIGLFIPGTHFTSHVDEDLGGEFDQNAYGGELTGTIHF